MKDSEILDIEKGFREDMAKIETLGVKIMFVYRCIYCGRYFDSIVDVTPHVVECQVNHEH